MVETFPLNPAKHPWIHPLYNMYTYMGGEYYNFYVYMHGYFACR